MCLVGVFAELMALFSSVPHWLPVCPKPLTFWPVRASKNKTLVFGLPPGHHVLDLHLNDSIYSGTLLFLCSYSAVANGNCCFAYTVAAVGVLNKKPCMTTVAIADWRYFFCEWRRVTCDAAAERHSLLFLTLVLSGMCGLIQKKFTQQVFFVSMSPFERQRCFD